MTRFRHWLQRWLAGGWTLAIVQTQDEGTSLLERWWQGRGRGMRAHTINGRVIAVLDTEER